MKKVMIICVFVLMSACSTDGELKKSPCACDEVLYHSGKYTA